MFPKFFVLKVDIVLRLIALNNLMISALITTVVLEILGVFIIWSLRNSAFAPFRIKSFLTVLDHL